MEYTKSYRGLILWMLGMFAGICLCAFLPVTDGDLFSRIALNACYAYVALLSVIIWRTESIYWYNGVEFEEARRAGSERRRIYALRHVLRFVGASAVCIAFSTCAHLLGVSIFIDIVVDTVVFVVMALATIRIRL